MISEFEIYLTFENIYFWSNIGILPFWLLLIFIPNSKLTRFLTNSIIIPLILSTAYIYTIYKAFLLEEKILEIFNLYSGLENLYTIFSTDSFLLIFWLHFLALNIFLGSWISIDASKYSISRIFTGIILILVYFSGPFGLTLYWFVRIFYSKKLAFHD
tara:strand:- start:220 stop:693 length:474 start_codon:yes stop_codon:yes gene_type:complete